MKAGRGEYKKEIARKNRDKIRSWLKKNPDGTLTQCTKDTGFSYITVRKHVDAIKQEQPTAKANGKSLMAWGCRPSSSF